MALNENQPEVKPEVRGSVDCDVYEHCAVVTFNNPQRHNAMSVSMWTELASTMASLAQQNDIRVVVLRGAGDKAFVSGADISEFGDKRDTKQQSLEYTQIVESAERAVSEFPKPTIAKIQGYCIGGGLGLALACDIRICSDDAIFKMPAGNLGLGYSYHDSTRMLRILGQAKASEMFYTARRFSAAEALDMGLVNTVVSAGELDATMDEWVAQISANAPLTLATFKACAINWARQDELVEHSDINALIDQCNSSDDYRNARRAFAEKRRPVFNGK